MFKRVRRASYLKVCAMLVPRELQVEHSGGVKAMTDEQIEQSIEIIKAMLAEREAGANEQIAEIEIDPAHLEDYKAAVREHIEAAIRVEPEVLVLYSVFEKDNPTHIRVFEIYASTEAYRAHLEAPHFKKYKIVTEKMVKSLKLVQTTPVMLGAKPR